MRRHIGRVDTLPDGGALTFEGVVRGERRPCFAVRSGGRVTAFLNVCAHRNQPVVVDDRPLDAEGRVECRAHGAHYDVATGDCVAGPCVGARLVAVPLEEDAGGLWAVDDDVVDDSVYADEG